MHLLIVNYEYPPVGAGASSASHFLAKTLVRQGHEVSVLTSAFGRHRGRTVEDGVRVHRIPALRWKIDRAGLGHMAAFAASGMLFTPRIVRREAVDGIIAFFTLPSGLIGCWMRRRYGVPYVVSLRGGDVPGLVPELNRTHRLIRSLRRQVLRSAQAIVANSPGLAELSQRTDPFAVTVIPNAVDSTLFRPTQGARAQADASAELRILFVGRLREQKNLSLLLDQLARLRKAGETAFRLDVAGDGPLGPGLRQRAADLGLNSEVVWHGWIGKAELLELYQGADCLVNPSLYEGSPNTVLEAMACGLAVVASRVPGNDNLVLDGDTGLLFSLKRPEELGNALRRLIRERGAGRQMGLEGRDRIEKLFSWETRATAYADLFSQPELRPGAL